MRVRAVTAVAAVAVLIGSWVSATPWARSATRAHPATTIARTQHARAPAGRRPAGSSAPALALITEPNQGIGPILDQVRAARHSVDMVMYELADPAFEAALAADAHRGVRVRVLLNGGYHGAGGFATNDAAFAYLRAHGVAVRAAPGTFALTHEKAIVVDGRVADIMTLNLTAQYYASSRDFAVLDRQPRDVAAIETTFDADWSGRQITAPTGTGDLVWSPGALESQLRLIDSSRHSLDVYNEEMDDAEITGALAAAARRGVDVTVVMTAASTWDSAFTQLSAAGVHVRTYPADAALYIHAKVIVVDSRTAFVGSQNFSAGSLDDNRELGIILHDPTILTSLTRTFTSDDAGAQAFRAPEPTHGAPTGSHSSCTVTAAFSTHYDDWDVYVRDAPPDVPVSVTADGITDAYHTDASGYADVYLKAPERDAGATVTVDAGSATCRGTL